MTSTSPNPIKIAVLGGGFAGIQFSNSFDKFLKNNKYSSVHITIIEPKDGIFYNVASHRMLVEPEIAQHMFIPTTNVVNNTRARKQLTQIAKKAKAVYETFVVLEDDSKIEFDVLCVATGARYADPGKTEITNTKDWVTSAQEFAGKVKEAKEVLIVGGGIYGCEVAAEVAAKYGNEKKVILLHSSDKLVREDITPKANKSAIEKLRKLGVEVRLNERAELSDELRSKGFNASRMTVSTSSGNKIDSDVQILALGYASFNSDFLTSLALNVLDERKQIKVLPTLQLPTHGNIFAVGDVNDYKETKTIIHARFQADHAAKSVKKIIDAMLKKGDKLSQDEIKALKLAEYKSKMQSMFLMNLGPKSGVGQMGSFVLGDFFGKFKGKDVMLGMSYQFYGLKAPIIKKD